jgi:hypothetical protein
MKDVSLFQRALAPLASGRPSAAGAAIAILLLGDASKSEAQVGARYRARDPQTCASRKDPAKGPITADLAKKYVTCHIEAESSGKLYLLENVTVEVGKGTPFKELPSSARPFGGDPDGLVYQIRGSLTRYQCAPISDILQNAGKNCNIYQEPKATGTCFRDGFADWVCNMTDLSPIKTYDVPPPARK